MSNEEQPGTFERNPATPVAEFLREIDGGPVFFWFLVVVAGYMFVTAGQFSSSAQLFPRLTAGTVLVAGALRLAVTQLDIGVERSEAVVLSGGHDESEEEDEGETTLESMLILGVLVIGYVLGGFFVGLFWPTPPFVFLYLLYKRQPLWRTALLTVAMTAVAYGFMTIMNLDLMTGGF
ncbi:MULTISPECIES: tripartite tricarboxylate transporter TctB family protein [unclassified Haladaptatus]|uniref:tripartite tricarboxylate transporter TctB family protein n=1 Tax=unclassified Haladaptatus TaxID=2622732 RepID=UPI00209C6D20|nr:MULTISPECIES: tripartite tricarboxylate transporter TctB family protein [unclassified Haladaptatus]MCO8246762.1 tripartite tricarboxylate transporter TctB family protein [Haladaptatus sp. AB643]MCO8256410.1 tripartite tricarboxylate transporter TctB family protein [Haladaptatus sp. AB618]